MSETQIIETPATRAQATAIPQEVQASPMGLMLQAMSQGVQPEQLGEMMALQERWEANEARKAFNQAMADFRQESEHLLNAKKSHVHYSSGNKGATDYHHAPLSEVVKIVSPVLAKHGLSFRWRTEQQSGVIRVTCVITHRDGHSEETSLEAAPDQSGGKNAVQAIGSTTTYLQRYTLKAICGVSEADDDTDGAVNEPTDHEQQEAHRVWITAMDSAEDIEKADEVWKTGLDAFYQPQDKYSLSMEFRAAYQAARKRFGATNGV